MPLLDRLCAVDSFLLFAGSVVSRAPILCTILSHGSTRAYGGTQGAFILTISIKAEVVPWEMVTLRPRASAIDSSGIHSAIGPADRWLPDHKMKGVTVVGLARMPTNPAPSDKLRQSTVP